MVRKGDDAVLLELWGGGRLLRELSVPPAVHGAVYNDGWFATGADWSADESRIAYVAEVCEVPHLSAARYGRIAGSLLLTSKQPAH